MMCSKEIRRTKEHDFFAHLMLKRSTKEHDYFAYLILKRSLFATSKNKFD